MTQLLVDIYGNGYDMPPTQTGITVSTGKVLTDLTDGDKITLMDHDLIVKDILSMWVRLITPSSSGTTWTFIEQSWAPAIPPGQPGYIYNGPSAFQDRIQNPTSGYCFPIPVNGGHVNQIVEIHKNPEIATNGLREPTPGSIYYFYDPIPGGCFFVQLVQNGGSNGTATSPASYLYDVYYNGTLIATALTPQKTRGNGEVIVANCGVAFFLTSWSGPTNQGAWYPNTSNREGSPYLWDTNEQPGTCEQTS